MLTPVEAYQEALIHGKILPNAQQAEVITHLQALYQAMITTKFGLSRWHAPKINGIYLWGTVGAGKTWLMDLFFNHLPIKAKQRHHFHDFMAIIHDQLQRWVGKRNPMQAVAQQFAQNARLLFLDEFYVSDIGDAMILANLLAAFIKQKMIIITTSNCAPENLYRHGLQRDRFIPTIDLIKKHFQVLSLSIDDDYRRRHVVTTSHNSSLSDRFTELAQGKIYYQHDIYLYERPIHTRGFADNIIWFDFAVLCQIPRSQRDYLAIAQRFAIMMVDNIPAITAEETNKIRYFISLIDILYDKKVKLIIASQVPIEQIYIAGTLLFDFARTKSRLIEMQSTNWQQH